MDLIRTSDCIAPALKSDGCLYSQWNPCFCPSMVGFRSFSAPWSSVMCVLLHSHQAQNLQLGKMNGRSASER